MEWHWQGKTVLFGEKVVSSATMLQANLTRNDSKSNSGLQRGKPSTNIKAP